jgi:hypothetical protein
MKTPVWLTEQEKTAMSAMCSQGASLRQCAKAFNVDQSTAALWVPRMGVPLRDAKQARRQYRVNDKAFAQSSRKAAYWLGFLLADGCVTESLRHGRTLRVALQSGDREHLEGLRAFLDAEHPIWVDPRRNCVGLTVTSNHLCNDLIRKGCYPRKSLTLCYPESGYFYRRHFIRGYFDGDGSIYINEAVHRQPTCSFVGTEAFLRGLQEVLVTEAGLNQTTIYKHARSAAWYLAYTGRGNIRKIYEYLYLEGGSCLLRKRAKFEYALCHGQLV